MWDPDATVNGPLSNLDGKKWGGGQILMLQLIDNFRIWRGKWGILMLQLMDHFRIWMVKNGGV